MNSPESFKEINLLINDDIAVLTLNRPEKLNSVTALMIRELIQAFDITDADDSVRVVIVTGAGDRAFCAGADLSAGASTFDYDSRRQESSQHRDGGGRVTLRIYESLKPVIGAINGAAVGMGATVLLPMDIRIASSTARFGFVFNRRGICPDAASSWFLPRVVGISRALEWCYSGKVFAAEEALQAGLIRSIHEPADLMDVAFQLAQEIASSTAPVSNALTRQMMWQMLGADHPMQAHILESAGVYSRGKTADAAEGVSSFLEKRDPVYSAKVSNGMPGFFPWGDKPEFEWIDET